MRRVIPVGALLVATLGAALVVGTVGAQQAGTIRIVAPANNATITGPVRVTVDIQGVTVKPAAEGDPNAYHYHIFVDVDPETVMQPGQPIVTGQANIIHTADLTVPIPDLGPGRHTITVVLTKTDHVPLTPNVQDRVTFTVAGATAQPTTPRTGVGTVAGAPLPLVALPAALTLLGAGLLAARRRRA